MISQDLSFRAQLVIRTHLVASCHSERSEESLFRRSRAQPIHSLRSERQSVSAYSFPSPKECKLVTFVQNRIQYRPDAEPRSRYHLEISQRHQAFLSQHSSSSPFS